MHSRLVGLHMQRIFYKGIAVDQLLMLASALHI